MAHWIPNLIAEELKDQLNAGIFSQPIAAVRAYRPVYELQDLGTLHVTVVPASYAEEPNSRSTIKGTVAAYVSVQKKPETLDNADLDPLADLFAEIADFLRFRNLPTEPAAKWIKTEMLEGAEAGQAAEHLDKFRQFTAVLKVTYTLGK